MILVGILLGLASLLVARQAIRFALLATPVQGEILGVDARGTLVQWSIHGRTAEGRVRYLDGDDRSQVLGLRVLEGRTTQVRRADPAPWGLAASLGLASLCVMISHGC